MGSCGVRHSPVVTMHAHVLHGTGVIEGCRWLLYAHHGRLLGQYGRTLPGGVVGMVVTASKGAMCVCVCVCVCECV